MKDLIVTFIVALVVTSIYAQVKSSGAFDQQPSTSASGDGTGQSFTPGGDSSQLQSQQQVQSQAQAAGDVFANGAPVPGNGNPNINVVAENADMPLLDEASFDRDVIKSASPVLVFFCSGSSEPCQEAYSPFQAAAAQLGDSFRIVRVDVLAHPTLAQSFGVSMVPTFMVFKDGRKVNQFTGVMPTKDLIALARKSLSAG